MGTFDRLREWLAGLLGGSAPADGNEAEPDESDARASEERNDGLDPTAVTETRTEATSDAVNALREVRESNPAGTEDTDGSEAPDPTESDGSDTATDERPEANGSDAVNREAGDGSGSPERGA